jgi:TP901 family phage tail tape measure protein
MDATVRVLFLGNAASAVRATGQLERGFGGLGRAAGTVAKLLAVGVVGGLAAAVKAAVDFDRSMRNVNTIAKLSESQFKSLSKSVLGLAKDTGQAPKTLAEGLYDIVSSGFDATNGLKVLRASAKAASAGLTDTATSTKAVVAVLNAYHLTADDATHVSDVLFQTVNKGVLTFEELASQIGDVLPIAAQLGVPLEDVGGAMATITLHGVSAAEASTQLKQVLVSILKPSEALAGTIKDMGFQTGEAALKTLGLEGFLQRLSTAAHGSGAAFAAWFPNVRAMNGALGLTGKNIATLHENLQAMRSSQGATQAAFAEQGKSIAFQWQRAKASLTAAAIPVGQLLLPALSAVAEKVADFAASVQSHMPQIRSAFGDLSTVVAGLGRGLGTIAGSSGGQSALVGLLATVGTAKTIGGTKNLIADIGGALRGLGPAGTIASVAAFALASAWYAATTQGNQFEDQIRGVEGALKHQQAATRSHADSLRAVQQAQINVSTTARQAEAAESLYARAVRESGKGSETAKAAYDNVRQAKLNATNATIGLRDATRLERQTRDEANKSVQRSAAAWAEFRQAAEKARTSFGLFGGKLDDGGRNVDHYAKAVAKLARDLGVGAGKADEYAAATRQLARAINGIPTFKQVRIQVLINEALTQVRTVITHVLSEIGVRHPGGTPRAMGGFIPGATGNPVPILAHAGEVVLNQAQQQALGGPRMLASMFGFTGARGPGSAFAAGGVVGGWPYRAPAYAPGRAAGRSATVPFRVHPHTRRPRVMIAVKSASADVARLFKLIGEDDFKEDLGGRQYADMESNFQIEEGNAEFILTDESGFEQVNSVAIGKRIADIQALMTKRDSLIAIYVDELAKRREYLTALNTAIEALIAAIRAQQERIKREQQAILELRGRIAGELAVQTAAGALGFGGGANPNLDAIRGWQTEITGHEKEIANAQTIIHTLTDDLTDYRSRRAEEPHNIAFANQDVAEQRTLRKQLAADLAEVNPAKFEAQVKADNAQLSAQNVGSDTGGGEFGAGDTGSFAGGADTGAAADTTGLAEKLADALAKIASLKLAVGIQGAQLGVIGSFQRGTLHVPHTGIYQLHAGEAVRTRDTSISGGGERPIDLHLHLDGDLAALAPMIDARVESKTEGIIVTLGREADRKQREGRWTKVG